MEPLASEVTQRRWFSWLVRFRGLTLSGSDSELSEISIDTVNDPSRQSTHGGLDSTWTTDLKLNQLCGDLKGKDRSSVDNVVQELLVMGLQKKTIRSLISQ